MDSMNNSKTSYLPPCIGCMIFSVQHVLAASTANDTLSDFNENNPSWIID